MRRLAATLLIAALLVVGPLAALGQAKCNRYLCISGSGYRIGDNIKGSPAKTLADEFKTGFRIKFFLKNKTDFAAIRVRCFVKEFVWVDMDAAWQESGNELTDWNGWYKSARIKLAAGPLGTDTTKTARLIRSNFGRTVNRWSQDLYPTWWDIWEARAETDPDFKVTTGSGRAECKIRAHARSRTPGSVLEVPIDLPDRMVESPEGAVRRPAPEGA